METYFCYNSNGSVIGVVQALSGNEAWAMAQVVQPGVAYLRVASTAIGTFWQASEHDEA